MCTVPGATPLERCANGAGCTALGAPANEEGGVASGAARLTPRPLRAARRFKWLSLPRATPRPARFTCFEKGLQASFSSSLLSSPLEAPVRRPPPRGGGRGQKVEVEGDLRRDGFSKGA